MSASEAILQKIKLLRNLGNSSNDNEAAAALAMADNLINKYGVTDEELKTIEDKKPLYGEDDKLFVTIGLVSWRQQLALGVGRHFDCYIVQEELVPLEGLHQFNYYVYGEPEDAANTKNIYNILSKKVEELIKIKCIGRGAIYISSYCEGVVESIKNNIYWNGIELPPSKRVMKEAVEEAAIKNGEKPLAKLEDKEKPEPVSVDVNSQSFIKDITAYFSGLDHGNQISLKDIFELPEGIIKN
jgi:hypothetical protein